MEFRKSKKLKHMDGVKVFPDNPQVAAAFAEEFSGQLNQLTTTKSQVSVALSGGSTPKLLFEILARDFADKIEWHKVHFFWVDERCVPPTDPESNFGEANRLLLSKINIPDENIHRVLGENDPAEEAVRYSKEIQTLVSVDESNFPAFDMLLLGMGSDGHTASIFPHESELLQHQTICAVGTHPESGQKRVTLTGPVLNAASQTYFLITGAGKAEILALILEKRAGHLEFPAAHVTPMTPPVFFVDEAAVSQLKSS